MVAPSADRDQDMRVKPAVCNRARGSRKEVAHPGEERGLAVYIAAVALPIRGAPTQRPEGARDEAERTEQQLNDERAEQHASHRVER